MTDEERPQYTLYKSRPKLLRRDDGGIDDLRGGIPRPEERRPRRRLTLGRALGYVALAAVGWVLLSLLLFFISAQVQRQDTTADVGSALDDGGYTLTSPNNVLVLGSDARTKETSEPGSTVGGRGRSDTILVMRVGGGASSR